MQTDVTSLSILSDYTILGKLHETLQKEQRICKLQVKNFGGRDYLEFSAGDVSTTTGWITQIFTRNCNQLLGFAGANRKQVIEHLYRMNENLEKYLISLSEIVKETTARNIDRIANIHNELGQIKKTLTCASKGIEVLKETYANDTTSSSLLLEIDQKIQELSQSHLQSLSDDISNRLHELAKRKSVKIKDENQDLLEKEKELYDSIDKLE